MLNGFASIEIFNYFQTAATIETTLLQNKSFLVQMLIRPSNNSKGL